MEYLDAYEENVALQGDWEMIMNHKPEVIYYAHANEKRFVCKGGEIQDDRCKVCGLWKSKKVDMCPACGGKMDFSINGLSLLWKCRDCEYGVATTANKLCAWDNGSYSKECYLKLEECPYSEEIT